MRRILILLAVGACVPPVQPPQQAGPSPSASVSASGCREDIPECVAACALRETSRPQFTEWFDRRCAAVILGKTPEDIANTTPRPVDLLDTR